MSAPSSCLADLALARRLESAAAQFVLRGARASCPLNLPTPFTVINVGGAQATFAGANSPYTSVVGLGMYEPMGAPEIDLLEAFYHDRNCSVHVALCSLAEPSVIQLLASRNYQRTGTETVLTRPLPSAGVPEKNASIEVRFVQPEEVRLFANTIAQGFLGPKNDARGDGSLAELGLKELVRIIQARVLGDQAPAAYLAFAGGQAIGGASLGIVDGVAALGGDATLSDFRGLGVQVALIRARLLAASEAGADVAMAMVLPGGVSYRNYERFGFEVAYTRTELVQPHPL